MIRLTLLALYVSFFAAYAFRDWFRSLCALILLMAVIEHPDMPKTIMGIQGFNPWNLLLVAVVAGWAAHRRQEDLTWDLPRPIAVLLGAYLSVVVIGFVRMIMNPDYLDASVLSLTSEHLVNTVKWVIPGLLLYDGCRSAARFRLAVATVLGVYLLLGLQVIKWMPLSAAIDGDSLSTRSLKILVNEVGYHRVNISAMLAGATWSVFAARALAGDRRERVMIILASGVLLFAQALTAGRAGYATSVAVGLTLCLLKWRRYLLLIPVLVMGLLVVAPGVAQRFTEGFTADTVSAPTRIRQLHANATGPDLYTITAGRNIIWPFVVAKIAQAPWIGYGRLAMVRTGLTSYLSTELDEGFSHPHNAYLELLLDNGIVGFVLIMPFYLLITWYAYGLFKDRRSAVFEGIGGATLAFVLALLIASMGSQSFYPREGWVGMWCLIFLMLRVRTQRDSALAAVAVSTAGARLRGFGRSRPVVAPATSAVSGALEPRVSRWGVRVRPASAPGEPLDETRLWPAAVVPAPPRAGIHLPGKVVRRAAGAGRCRRVG